MCACIVMAKIHSGHRPNLVHCPEVKVVWFFWCFRNIPEKYAEHYIVLCIFDT